MQKLSQHLLDQKSRDRFRKWAERSDTVDYLNMALADITPHMINPDRPIDPVMLAMQGGIERGRRYQISLLLTLGAQAEAMTESTDYGMRESLKELGWTDAEIDEHMEKEANRE